jgi:putative transposase
MCSGDEAKVPDTPRFPVRRRIRLPQPTYREGHVFLVTIGTAERCPWFGKSATLADRAVAVMCETARLRETLLHAWCIMPDHVHMLVQDADLIEFVRLFKGRLTPAARELLTGRSLWQRSFHDHGLRREESVEQVTQYIFENPVRGGLVASPADYLWSGSNTWPEWREYYRGRG